MRLTPPRSCLAGAVSSAEGAIGTGNGVVLGANQRRGGQQTRVKKERAILREVFMGIDFGLIVRVCAKRRYRGRRHVQRAVTGKFSRR